VVRRIRKYVEAAEVEAEILADVNAADPTGVSLIVRFYAAFSFQVGAWYRGCRRICVLRAFHAGPFLHGLQALGPSLYDYVKANEYRPVPLYALQAFADQLITSVAFLHAMQLVHTDLKVRGWVHIDLEVRQYRWQCMGGSMPAVAAAAGARPPIFAAREHPALLP